MKNLAQDQEQTRQRLRVGSIGLAGVLLLIGLAAAIFSTASHERPTLGGARADVVANMVAGNMTAPSEAPTSEPLAELGVAPSTATETVDVTQIANRIDARAPAQR